MSDGGNLDISTVRQAPVELASARVDGDTVRWLCWDLAATRRFFIGVLPAAFTELARAI